MVMSGDMGLLRRLPKEPEISTNVTTVFEPFLKVRESLVLECLAKVLIELKLFCILYIVSSALQKKPAIPLIETAKAYMQVITNNKVDLTTSSKVNDHCNIVPDEQSFYHITFLNLNLSLKLYSVKLLGATSN